MAVLRSSKLKTRSGPESLQSIIGISDCDERSATFKGLETAPFWALVSPVGPASKTTGCDRRPTKSDGVEPVAASEKRSHRVVLEGSAIIGSTKSVYPLFGIPQPDNLENVAFFPRDIRNSLGYKAGSASTLFASRSIGRDGFHTSHVFVHNRVTGNDRRR